jgi:hypothetical protein
MKNLRRLAASLEPGPRLNWDDQSRVVHPWGANLRWRMRHTFQFGIEGENELRK